MVINCGIIKWSYTKLYRFIVLLVEYLYKIVPIYAYKKDLASKFSNFVFICQVVIINIYYIKKVCITVY